MLVAKLFCNLEKSWCWLSLDNALILSGNGSSRKVDFSWLTVFRNWQQANLHLWLFNASQFATCKHPAVLMHSVQYGLMDHDEQKRQTTISQKLTCPWCILKCYGKKVDQQWTYVWGAVLWTDLVLGSCNRFLIITLYIVFSIHVCLLTCAWYVCILSMCWNERTNCDLRPSW